jgi:TolA-binding protein
MFRRICAWILIASPAVAFGADKAIMDLQRDVAQLQDTVKQLQRSQDEKFGAILELVKQLVGNSNEASKAVAVMQSGLQQSLQDTQSKVVTPVAGLSTRMDQMSNDLNKVENAVSDLAPILAKIQTQLNDLNNNVKVLQAPAPAPPAPAGTAPGGSAVALPSMPPISATDLYNNADRDRSGGHLDLALQEFSDYLKYYGNTAQAPAAQFYIGFIHYGQKDFETAAQDFDLVLEKYPTDIARVPEATYYKGMSLERITGHRTEASQEYKELIKQFPDSDYAKKACTELQVLGLRCSAPTTAPPAKSAAKKKK